MLGASEEALGLEVGIKTVRSACVVSLETGVDERPVLPLPLWVMCNAIDAQMWV